MKLIIEVSLEPDSIDDMVRAVKSREKWEKTEEWGERFLTELFSGCSINKVSVNGGIDL